MKGCPYKLDPVPLGSGARPPSMEDVISLAEAVPREAPETQGVNACLQCGHSLQGIWCPRCGWSYNPGDQ